MSSPGENTEPAAAPAPAESKTTVAPTMGNIIGALMGFKAIRIALTYLSLTITTNFMTQIYMEKVLVNNEAPPTLLNFVWLFMFIDVIINFVLVLVLILLGKLGALGPAKDLYGEYILDYGVCLVCLIPLALIVANVMYSKKYFLYKDDGLRAIRALSDIIFYISIVINLIPFGLMQRLTTQAIAKPGELFDDVVKSAEKVSKLNTLFEKGTTGTNISDVVAILKAAAPVKSSGGGMKIKRGS